MVQGREPSPRATASRKLHDSPDEGAASGTALRNAHPSGSNRGHASSEIPFMGAAPITWTHNSKELDPHRRSSACGTVAAAP